MTSPSHKTDAKCVLVTGCSSGIGRAAVRGLAERGYDVVAWTRTAEQAASLGKDGIRAIAVENTSVAQIQEGWRATKELNAGRPIWGVFANAGYGQPGALEDMPSEALDLQLRTNVVGTHELLRQAIADMRVWGGGRLIVCSSVLGVVALRNRGAYVASKFALEGMCDVLRLELKGTGIGVSLLEPGPVLTNFRANGLKMFKQYIDTESSPHKDAYVRLEQRLATKGPIVRFTAMASECTPMLAHALEARSPKARYRWTVQTRVFSVLKRLLPTAAMDYIAAKG